MSELGDPAIKLFGKEIPVPEIHIPTESFAKSDIPCQFPAASIVMDEYQDARKTKAETRLVEPPVKRNPIFELEEGEVKFYENSIRENEASRSLTLEEERVCGTNLGGQEKTLTKPEKILPCPRCNSLDTKFCYFNNYNVNQPRHFCKNCQRYWTAGGTMRNVPIGAGRRKNKHPSSLPYRHCNKAGTSKVDTSSPTTDQVSSASPKSENRIEEALKFGRDTPICKSMGTVLKIKDQEGVQIQTGYVAPAANEEEPFSSKKKDFPGAQGPLHSLQSYPGPSTYHWNPGWNGMFTPDTSNCNPLQWGGSPPLLVPRFCTPSFTFPFVPVPPYWGCMPSWETRNSNTQSAGPTLCTSPSFSSSNSGCSDSGSPTLGKHSREEDLLSEEKTEKSLWVPKTLRIDDSNDAAKSSIWATFGIKSNKSEPISKGSVFKAFQHKQESTAHTSDASPVLQANPAALSRSKTFQERTQ